MKFCTEHNYVLAPGEPCPVCMEDGTESGHPGQIPFHRLPTRCCAHRRLDHAGLLGKTCTVPGCTCPGWVTQPRYGNGRKGVKKNGL